MAVLKSGVNCAMRQVEQFGNRNDGPSPANNADDCCDVRIAGDLGQGREPAVKRGAVRDVVSAIHAQRLERVKRNHEARFVRKFIHAPAKGERCEPFRASLNRGEVKCKKAIFVA